MQSTGKNSAPEADDKVVDADALLRDLAARWRGAATLEYQSAGVMDHQGEPRIEVETRAWLRRPGQARLVFTGNTPETNRTRVSDGRLLYDRYRRRGGRPVPATTLRIAFRGALLENIAHPLEACGYSIAQFFSTDPFVPPASWGGGGPLTVSAIRTLRMPGVSAPRPLYRVRFSRGAWQDTLWLDRFSLAPLRLERFGNYDGRFQMGLTETFSAVRLGFPLPPSLFRWTENDEDGK